MYEGPDLDDRVVLAHLQERLEVLDDEPGVVGRPEHDVRRIVGLLTAQGDHHRVARSRRVGGVEHELAEGAVPVAVVAEAAAEARLDAHEPPAAQVELPPIALDGHTQPHLEHGAVVAARERQPLRVDAERGAEVRQQIGGEVEDAARERYRPGRVAEGHRDGDPALARFAERAPRTGRIGGRRRQAGHLHVAAAEGEDRLRCQQEQSDDDRGEPAGAGHAGVAQQCVPQRFVDERPRVGDQGLGLRPVDVVGAARMMDDHAGQREERGRAGSALLEEPDQGGVRPGRSTKCVVHEVKYAVTPTVDGVDPRHRVGRVGHRLCAGAEVVQRGAGGGLVGW